jgi:hypothetical protein
MLAVILLFGLLALTAIMISGIPPLLKGLAAGVVLVTASLTVRRLHRPAIGRIELQPDRLLLKHNGETIPASRFKAVFLSAWYLGFIVLDGQGRRLLEVGLFREQLGRDSFRRLSSWFRDRP